MLSLDTSNLGQTKEEILPLNSLEHAKAEQSLIEHTNIDPVALLKSSSDLAERTLQLAQAQNEQFKVSDRNAGSIKNRVLELNYGDPDIDTKMAQSAYHTLRIKNLPPGVNPSPWLDEKGFFIWFDNGNDNRQKHYFHPDLKKLEVTVAQGNRMRTYEKSADEMRLSVINAYMKQQNGEGFASYSRATDPITYAARMSSAANNVLQLQENLLRQGAESSPTNPYFRIYLADVITAQAIQPIVNSIPKELFAELKDPLAILRNPEATSGDPERNALLNQKLTQSLSNPQTLQKIDEAILELRKAQFITRKYGDIMTPPRYEIPLSPFGLNPYYYNPDYYWSGAAYQAQVREVQLNLLKGLLTLSSRVPGGLEILPPALAPR